MTNKDSLPVSGKLDADGLPIPDEKLFAAWRAEALRELPNPNDWADLVALLRWEVELERQGQANADLPEDMTVCQRALFAVAGFLGRQPAVARGGYAAPLIRLHGAIRDLADGRQSPLFKPTRRTAGSPGKGFSYEYIKGMAARTLDELIDGKQPPALAAGRVAKAVKGRKDMLDVTAETVSNWRERHMQGPGPGVTTDSLKSWLETFPKSFGNTPLKLGNSLVKLLKERAYRI